MTTEFKAAKVIISLIALLSFHFCFSQDNLDPVVLYKIHLGLSEPVYNDFVQARRLSVLSSLAPVLSYTDLMIKMENGISENNYLHKYLKSLTQAYGLNKDILVQELVASFSLTYKEAKYFLDGGNGWEGFLRNPDMFEGIGYNRNKSKWVYRDGTVFSQKESNKRRLQLVKIKNEQEMKIRKEEANLKAKQEAEKAEKLRLFLIERKTEIYDYKELSPTSYADFIHKVEQNINYILTNSELSNVNYNGIFVCKIDSNGILQIQTESVNSNNKNFEKMVYEKIKEHKLPAATKYNYFVNASFNLSLDINNYSEGFSITKNSADIFLENGNAKKFAELKNYLINDFERQSLPIGKYELIYSKNTINYKGNESVKYLKYTGLGGPSNCLFSLIVPGLGNKFVNRKKTSRWLITTVGVIGLIGGGVYENLLSKDNYEKYKNSTTQSDMDSYYDKANSQNQTSYNLIKIGVCWWVADIINVAIKGDRNRSATSEAKSKLNLALYPSILNNTYSLGIQAKF